MDIRRLGCTRVMSGELTTSPADLVGAWSLSMPKFESLIWSAMSFPLVSVWIMENQRG